MQQTLDQYLTEIEDKLIQTDFYDVIIMFCGSRNSTNYNKVVEGISRAIVRAYYLETPIEIVVKSLLEANQISAALCLMAEDNLTKN